LKINVLKRIHVIKYLADICSAKYIIVQIFNFLPSNVLPMNTVLVNPVKGLHLLRYCMHVCVLHVVTWAQFSAITNSWNPNEREAPSVVLDRNWISELVVPLPDSRLGTFRLVNWSSHIEKSRKSQPNNFPLLFKDKGKVITRLN
jgi:hypothetical protein